MIWLGITRWEMERDARLSTPVRPVLHEKSVAVLPFENLNSGNSDELLVNGIQEDVLKHLAKISDLKVIASDSVRSYKPGIPRDLPAIARALGVKYLVEGSMSRDAKRVRVNAQLVDATTGARRWAEHYDRNAKNLFDINTELTRAIAHQLHARITSSGESGNRAAAYHQSRGLRSLPQGEFHKQEAISVIRLEKIFCRVLRSWMRRFRATRNFLRLIAIWR